LDAIKVATGFFEIKNILQLIEIPVGKRFVIKIQKNKLVQILTPVVIYPRFSPSNLLGFQVKSHERW
jgi:hypothetical protein